MTLHWQTLEFAQLSPHELYAVLRLRQEIFVVEQNCVYLDLDGLDQQAIHMLCKDEVELVAYQRCLAPGVGYRESSIGRIVVASNNRGRDRGRELVRRGITYNLQTWPSADILINAQAHLQDFYSSLGFVAEGSTHIEDGIEHRHMRYASSAVKTSPGHR